MGYLSVSLSTETTLLMQESRASALSVFRTQIEKRGQGGAERGAERAFLGKYYSRNSKSFKGRCKLVRGRSFSGKKVCPG